MFNLNQFISDYVTKRPRSMFLDDIEQNRDLLSQRIKFLLPVRLSARQASRYYARPYTARKRAGRKNVLYADSPQAAGY